MRVSVRVAMIVVMVVIVIVIVSMVVIVVVSMSMIVSVSVSMTAARAMYVSLRDEVARLLSQQVAVGRYGRAGEAGVGVDRRDDGRDGANSTHEAVLSAILDGRADCLRDEYIHARPYFL